MLPDVMQMVGLAQMAYGLRFGFVLALPATAPNWRSRSCPRLAGTGCKQAFPHHGQSGANGSRGLWPGSRWEMKVGPCIYRLVNTRPGGYADGVAEPQRLAPIRQIHEAAALEPASWGDCFRS